MESEATEAGRHELGGNVCSSARRRSWGLLRQASNMNSRRTALLLLALGTGLGMAIWFLSVPLTGRVEPWDADLPIWSLSWLVVAVLGGLAGNIRGVCLPIGYALGQMLVTTRSVFVGEFGALGWMFIAGYALVAALLTLAIVGAIVLARRVLRSRSRTIGGA